jgi:peptide/nickel transport system permease protein
MKAYISHRLLQLIPIVLGITFFSFALMQTVAGDAVDALYDNAGGVSEQVKAERRAELGLDKPFLIQYARWLKGLSHGDMGVSYISGKPIFQTFMAKLPATLLLMVSSIVLTVIVSIPLGIIAALKRNDKVDYLIRGLTFAGNSMPGFFTSLLLIYFFSLKMRLLPVMGSNAGWKSIILPTATLAIAMSSKYIRQVRATVLEELQKDYVMGARARGVRESVIIFRSVLKSATLTIITLLSLSIGSLLGGAAIIETIFMWDGVGKLAVDSIVMRDYPMIQAYVIWMALIYVAVNLATDLLYHLLDPRIRKTHEN